MSLHLPSPSAGVRAQVRFCPWKKCWKVGGGGEVYKPGAQTRISQHQFRIVTSFPESSGPSSHMQPLPPPPAPSAGPEAGGGDVPASRASDAPSGLCSPTPPSLSQRLLFSPKRKERHKQFCLQTPRLSACPTLEGTSGIEGELRCAPPGPACSPGCPAQPCP